MSFKFKKGVIKIEGTDPVSFVEKDSEINSYSWTPEQDDLAKAVLLSITKYIESTKNAISSKFMHLKGLVPEYLSNPGNLIIAVCNDGVVIRYEKKEQEDFRRIVSVVPQSIVDVTALLSQNLIYIDLTDNPQPPKDDFGARLKLSAQPLSNGSTKDIFDTRIWFQVKNNSPKGVKQQGAKPYCLFSVRNQLDVELHGFMIPQGNDKAPQQPFIVRSNLRLFAGWDCIEVFPGLNIDDWNYEFAPLWAENDILGSALITQTKDVQLNSLDPRASARRFYASLLSSFKSLLDSDPEREQILQSFLQENPVLLCPTHVHMWPKLPFGSTITDFVFCDANQEYILVELERSTLSLFRQDGHTTADFNHAHGQIIDWKRYLEDNLATVQRELGLTGITPNPIGLLVMGRSQSLTTRDQRKLQTLVNESPKLKVMTYDDVYENSKAVFENLLGPIWDTGGSTQVYYPTTK
jgi:hypothetical protein